MGKLVRCYEITPAADTSYDSVVVPAGKSWEPALREAEASLESQFLNGEDTDDEWKGMRVEVRCVLKTQKELDDLMGDGT